METNKSILLREVISLEDGKSLGYVRDVLIDGENKKVGQVLVSDDTFTSLKLLPWKRVIGSGNAFITVAEERFLSSATEGEGKKVFNASSRLKGIEVFSRQGDRVGIVEGYEFDASTGDITNVSLVGGSVINPEDIIFISSLRMFIESSDAVEVPKDEPIQRKSAHEQTNEVTPEQSTEKTNSDESDENHGASTQDEEESKEAPSEKNNDSDDELLALLIDAVLTNDVSSADGKFLVKKGTKLTEELLKEAQAHNALLLLITNVDM